MATTPAFQYQEPFPLAKDETKYRLLGTEGVSVSTFDGKEILKVEPSALALIAREALRECSFFLRPAHNEQVAKILADPEASQNDKGVSLAMLRNAEIAARGELPICQDTGTATILGKKGQQVWTGAKDEEWLSKGVYETYTQQNLRYSQTVALNLYDEKNTGTNLPAQIDLYATQGAEYKFLFVAKGGGSANKTMLFQETKALLSPEKLEKYLVDKMKYLGTAACPPYHIAVAIGGTSAEACLKTVKLASAKYYAGPAKTPPGKPSGSFGPTTAGRMDSYVELLQSHGASMVMIAKGNRSQQVTDACKKHGGFYLGSIGGPAAILAEENIKKVECIDFPELGMEAVWKIEVENFPAFILVDDKGTDFFKQLGL